MAVTLQSKPSRQRRAGFHRCFQRVFHLRVKLPPRATSTVVVMKTWPEATAATKPAEKAIAKDPTAGACRRARLVVLEIQTTTQSGSTSHRFADRGRTG
jgi:hypothetical protein